MKEVITRLNIESPVRTIEYLHIRGKGVKYRLRKDIFYMTGFKGKGTSLGAYITLYSDGWLLIRAGYESNGANIVPDSDSVLRAAFIHDVLCELRAKGSLVDTVMIHDTFRDICKADGMNKWVYKAYRLGLRLG
jgi:hypothetical protein